MSAGKTCQECQNSLRAYLQWAGDLSARTAGGKSQNHNLNLKFLTSCNLKAELVLIALFLLFAYRFNQARSLLANPSWEQIYAREIRLRGEVVEPPQIIGSRQKITLAQVKVINQTHCDGRVCRTSALPGKLLVTTRLYPRFQYGQALDLKGKIQDPPVFEDFDYKRYLALNGIYGLIYWPEIKASDSRTGFAHDFADARPGRALFALIYRFRSQVQERAAKLFPEPHATLLAGIVFGIPGSFTPDTYQALQKSGVLHVIVASGYNVLIVASFFMSLAWWWGRYQAVLITAAGLAFYAILAGLEPPILRAVIMGGGSLLAMLLQRQRGGLTWLGLSALALLIFRPLWLYSLSFQLSFMASLALLTIHPWVDRRLRFLPAVLHESFATTLSVQLFTLPLIWWNFKKFYWVSILVNTLVLPAVDFLMTAGALVVGVSFVSLRLARILSLPLWLLLEYFIGMVRVFT